MRITKILLILLIFPLSSYCQEKKKIEKGDVLIKISPMSMLPTNLPFLEIGASYHFNGKSGIQLKYGKKFDIYNPDDEFRNKGYKLTFEYMHFIKRRLYAALEFGYLTGKYSDSMDYYESDRGEDETRDYYTALDEKIFLTPKAGFMFFFSHKLSIDFFGGLGIQYHYREISELEYDPLNGNIWTDMTEWGFAAGHEDLDDIQLRLTLGFNLNYRF